MFGHDDKAKDDKQDEAAVSTAADQVVSPDNGDNNDSWQHPGPPPSDSDDDAADSPATEDFTSGHDSDDTSDSTDNNGDHAASIPTPFSTTANTSPAPDTDSDGSNHDLIDIKQDALGKLTPLIGHLDQTPDEKFRTLMMMIQASDDQSLVKQAYDTALEIEDEKTRAQALLDIVNEINYFTQNPKAE